METAGYMMEKKRQEDCLLTDFGKQAEMTTTSGLKLSKNEKNESKELEIGANTYKFRKRSKVDYTGTNIIRDCVVSIKKISRRDLYNCPMNSCQTKQSDHEFGNTVETVQSVVPIFDQDSVLLEEEEIKWNEEHSVGTEAVKVDSTFFGKHSAETKAVKADTALNGEHSAETKAVKADTALNGEHSAETEAVKADTVLNGKHSAETEAVKADTALNGEHSVVTEAVKAADLDDTVKFKLKKVQDRKKRKQKEQGKVRNVAELGNIQEDTNKKYKCDSEVTTSESLADTYKFRKRQKIDYTETKIIRDYVSSLKKSTGKDCEKSGVESTHHDHTGKVEGSNGCCINKCQSKESDVEFRYNLDSVKFVSPILDQNSVSHEDSDIKFNEEHEIEAVKADLTLNGKHSAETEAVESEKELKGVHDAEMETMNTDTALNEEHPTGTEAMHTENALNEEYPAEIEARKTDITLNEDNFAEAEFLKLDSGLNEKHSAETEAVKADTAIDGEHSAEIEAVNAADLDDTVKFKLKKVQDRKKRKQKEQGKVRNVAKLGNIQEDTNKKYKCDSEVTTSENLADTYKFRKRQKIDYTETKIIRDYVSSLKKSTGKDCEKSRVEITHHDHTGKIEGSSSCCINKCQSEEIDVEFRYNLDSVKFVSPILDQNSVSLEDSDIMLNEEHSDEIETVNTGTALNKEHSSRTETVQADKALNEKHSVEIETKNADTTLNEDNLAEAEAYTDLNEKHSSNIEAVMAADLGDAVKFKQKQVLERTQHEQEKVGTVAELGDVQDEIRFTVGDVVWGRFGKTWWPAVVVSGAMVKKMKIKGYLWVYWLYDRQISHVRSCDVEPFQAKYISRCKQKKRPAMQLGIKKALEICASRANVDLTEFESLDIWAEQENGFLQIDADKFKPDPDFPVPAYILKDLKCISEYAESGVCHKEQSGVVYNDESQVSSDKEKTDQVIPASSLEMSTCSEQFANVHEIGQLNGRYINEKTCMVCGIDIQVGSNHPLFEGKLCGICKKTLKLAIYAQDDDGSGMYCGICGEGKQLYICDEEGCARVFCTSCVERHTSLATAEQIKKAEKWKCFLCEKYSRQSHGNLVPRTDWSLEVVRFYQDDKVSMCKDIQYLANGGSRKIRVLSLFDGIGTGKVALDELGLDVEVYYASEVSSDAKLVANFNHSLVQLGDIWSLDSKKLQELCPIDLVLAAPPCNDLSIVNPARKGFNGTGALVWKFVTLLKDIQMICQPTNHVFWLMENTGSMLTQYKDIINQELKMKPVRWDAKDFSGQRRARYFWGNIPGMFTPAEFCKHLEKDKRDLDFALTGHYNRKARITHTRTVTTSTNSLTITNGVNDPLVSMDGEPSHIWLSELERLFGFPEHYTDVGCLNLERRQKLIGRAWSVPVIKHLLSPLKHYFKVKDT